MSPTWTAAEVLAALSIVANLITIVKVFTTMERRLTKLETYMGILVARANIHVRVDDEDLPK